MVNEPDEVLEEMPDADETEAEKLAYHVHTDDCYEDVLICELEENEEHTHTEECYEKQLICGFEDEKEAEASAEAEVTGEDEAEAAEAPETEEAESAETEETEESEDEEEAVLDAQLPEMMMAAGPQVMADNVGTINTADSRADGIRINLFDYGTSSIDDGKNNYNSPVFEGINYNWDTGEARTNENDILFFSYGTPNTVFETVDGKRVATQALAPTKNHYSGNYDFDPQLSGNRPVSGIVNNKLVGGFPKVAGKNGSSLAYLFDLNNIVGNNTNDPVKTVYADVNKLLTKDEKGKYSYNSDKNYAYFNEDTYDFTVYNSTFRIQNDNHHLANDLNIKSGKPGTPPTTYGNQNGYPLNIGFFPFNEYNPNHVDPNFDAVEWNEDGSNGQGEVKETKYYNHHFGMTMEADFTLSSDNDYRYNGEDVVFDYSGDDDMWVFVDDVLVLDVGGIHEPAAGTINFTKGYVYVEDEQLTGDYELVNRPEASQADANGQIKMKKTSMHDLFTAAGESGWVPEGKHTIKVFYLERGGNYSNLAMEFNLPTVKPITVAKQLDKGGHYSSDYDDNDYTFCLYCKKDSGDEPVTGNYTLIKADGSQEIKTTNSDGTFTIKSGERAVFDNHLQELQYYVKELNVDSSIYSEVSVNGVIKAALDAGSGTQDVYSDPQLLKDNGQFNFTNKVREETTQLEVIKVWGDSSTKNHDGDMIRFRVTRTDEENNTTKDIAYENHKTFALNNSNNWQKTFTGLPARYGTHRYSYSVTELDVPMGYAVSYSNSFTDTKQTSTITNTPTDKVEMHVKKEWVGNDGKDYEVKLQLYRDWVEYGPPAPTTLTIKAVDKDGNVIKTWMTNKAYVGGRMEFALKAPEGVEYQGYAVDNCEVSMEDDIWEVTKITGADPVVTIMYKEKTAPLAEIVHCTFDNSAEGWAVRSNNDYAVISGKNKYATTNSLLIKEPENASVHSVNGLKYDLDPTIFIPGQSYSFGIYASADNDNNNKTDTNRRLAFTLHYYDPDAAGTNEDPKHKYIWLDNKEVPKDTEEWIYLHNDNFTIPSDAEDVYIYVESAPESGDKLYRFRIDEFVAARAGVHAEVAPGSGELTLTGKAKANPINHDTFDNGYTQPGIIEYIPFNVTDSDGKIDGWEKRKDGANNEYSFSKGWNDPYAGATNIVIRNRTKHWEGAQYALDSSYIPGQSYSFGIFVRNESDESAEFKLSLQYEDGNGVSHWPSIATKTLEPYTWTELKNSNYKIPEDAKNCYIYVETNDSNNNPKVNFRIDEFVSAQPNTNYFVNPGGGGVSVLSSAGDISPWTKNANGLTLEYVTGANAYSKQSLRISNRNKTWQGIRKELSPTAYIPGSKYSFTMYAMCEEPRKFQLTLQYTPKSGGTAYKCIDDRDGEAYEWIQLSNPRYQIPDDVDTTKPMYLYVEAKYIGSDNEDDTCPFYVDEFIEAPMGYTASVDRSTGVVTLTFSSGVYDMTLDEDTSIAPYTEGDNGKEAVGDPFVLSDGNLTKNWTTAQLSENPNRSYVYYVEELAIRPKGSTDAAWIPINDARLGDFDVSYNGNRVQTNTTDNPIVVQNKYIWYTLPATGGIGADKIVLLGLALTIIGILSGCSVYSRRRRPE